MATILISGGSGLIGTHLTRHLLDRDYHVIVLTRKKQMTSGHARLRYSHWNVEEGVIDRTVLQQCDHIVHLAGAGVMDKRWTAAYRRELLESRTKSAQLILDTLSKLEHRVKSFLSAGGSGYYGEGGSRTAAEGFRESERAGDDFLAQVCLQWEEASAAAENMGIRRVIFRQGQVLANEGGALPEYKMPLKFGVAPLFAGGRQQVCWLHIEDLCRLYTTAIENDYYRGAYNAVSPEVVSQKEFIFTLGQVMRGKFFISIHLPAILLKLLYGKRSIELLKSAPLSSKKLSQTGFKFLYPTLSGALKNLTGRDHSAPSGKRIAWE